MTVALVTNDDGISSPGLAHLAKMALAAGLTVVVAAPFEESSGSSAGLTAVESGGKIVVEPRELEGLSGIDVYGVAGLPGFISLIASRGAFGPPPDVVLSGINRGLNTGHAIVHSGTVGAALTGCLYGAKALAVSAEIADTMRWDIAVEAAQILLPRVLRSDHPVVFNLNVPARPVRGIRRAKLASFGAVQTNITEAGAGYVRVSVTDVDEEHEPGTDAALVAEGYATVSAIRPMCTDDDGFP